MFDHVRVGVAALIYNDKDEVLIGQRIGAHGTGTWGFPGGHIEKGETPEDCARRETREEAGLVVHDVRLLGFTNDIFSVEKHYITLFVECLHWSGTPQNCEPDKHENWEWHSWDALPTPYFSPIDNLLAGPFADKLRMKQNLQAA